MTTGNHQPVAEAQMLIRKPASIVFEAFVDPAITSRFWFSRGSGRLEAGSRVRWDWEMYGVGTTVDVKVIEPGKRILIEWDVPENPTSVEWTFEAKAGERTFVKIRNWGFSGKRGGGCRKSAELDRRLQPGSGRRQVLPEHAVEPDLVVDHASDALVAGWSTKV